MCFGDNLVYRFAKLMAYFKEDVSISSFPICQNGYLFGLVDNFRHGLDAVLKRDLSLRTIVYPEDSSGGIFS